jgi:gas vesicle protein
MPKYIYKCLKCEKTFEVSHSFKEKYKICCEVSEECKEASAIERIPQNINLVKSYEAKTQTGQIVKDFINDTKKEVKEYKEEMKNWKSE